MALTFVSKTSYSANGPARWHESFSHTVPPGDDKALIVILAHSYYGPYGVAQQSLYEDFCSWGGYEVTTLDANSLPSDNLYIRVLVLRNHAPGTENITISWYSYPDWTMCTVLNYTNCADAYAMTLREADFPSSGGPYAALTDDITVKRLDSTVIGGFLTNDPGDGPCAAGAGDTERDDLQQAGSSYDGGSLWVGEITAPGPGTHTLSATPSTSAAAYISLLVEFLSHSLQPSEDISVAESSTVRVPELQRSITQAVSVSATPTLDIPRPRANVSESISVTATPTIQGPSRPAKSDAVSVSASATVAVQAVATRQIAASESIVASEDFEFGISDLILHVYQTIGVTDVLPNTHGPIQYAGDDSLGVKYHETKYHPHTSKWYLAVKTPRIVWKGRVVGNRGDAHEGDIMDDFVIEASGGANQPGFDVTDFLPDLTVWIGTTDGGTEHGRCRIRHFNDATHLHVSADGSCIWRNTDYISITDLHDYWPRPPKVEADGDNVDVHKDEDIPDSDRHEYPVPVMGPPACAFIDEVTGKATVQFDGGLSYVVQPNSLEYDDPALAWDNQGITAWAWWFEGADVTTASTRLATALYSTPGQYVVRLTVTGQGGYTERGFRNVFIFDRSANQPVTQFTVNRLSGSLNNRGWEAEMEIFGDNFDKANMPNGAQAVLFAEEWYAGVAKASDYGIKADTYRSNIKMVGWLVQTRMNYGAKKTRNAQVTLRGLQEYIKSYSNFPVYFTQVEREAPDWSFFNVDENDPLTVRKALYHLVKWHWTVLNFADFLIPDDHNNYVPGQNFAEGSLASQMESFTKDIQADWCCDCSGALIVFSKPNWLAHSGRGSRWRARYYRDNILNGDDFSELEVEPRVTDETAKVRVEGLTGHDDDRGWDAYVDSVPDDSRGYAGETFVLSNQVIGTGGAETGGPYNEMTQGFELARMVYAELTRPVERIRMTMTGNYSQFDIVPQASFFKLTVNSPDRAIEMPLLRDIRWNQKPFWATDIEYQVAADTGDVGTTISAIPETWMSEDVAAYAMYDDLSREKGEKMPKGGSGSFGSYSKSVDTPDVRVVPGLMGNGGGLIDCFQTGKVFVRLYGDAAYCVLADCRGIKPINDRPVDVQIVQRYDNQGRPAQVVYSVIAVRTSGFGGATDQDRGYITRVPTFVIAGSAVVQLTDQCPPLKVVDARIFARRIHVLAINAPAGGTCVFTVNLNLAPLGVVTLGDGATEAITVLTETLMEDGDELHLFVSGTATTMPSQVMIEVECREYGL